MTHPPEMKWMCKQCAEAVGAVGGRPAHIDGQQCEICRERTYWLTWAQELQGDVALTDEAPE